MPNLKIATKKIIIEVDRAYVRFDFADGKTIEVNLDSFSDTMQRHFSLHGIAQKLGDSYANAESFAQAFNRFETLLAQLRQGIWNIGRQSSGGIWVEALQRATGSSFDDCLAKWDSLTKTAKADLKKHPKVRAAHAEITAERAKAELDAIGEDAAADDFDLDAI